MPSDGYWQLRVKGEGPLLPRFFFQTYLPIKKNGTAITIDILYICGNYSLLELQIMNTDCASFYGDI